MPTQIERRDATRSAIVDAARAEFVAAGSPDVALEPIADAAGVTKGTIHYHFVNRAGLLAAVATSIFRTMEARIAGTDPDADAVAYIEALLVAQSAPVGAILFMIGDELARSGELAPVDPYAYLCRRLAGAAVIGSVEVIAAAVVQLARQLAFGLADEADIPGFVAALRTGGRIG